MIHKAIDQRAISQIFLNARTHSFWTNTPVKDDLLKQAYELARMAPTSANCCPMRIVFVKSKEAKELLRPCLAEGNVEKTMSAPVTAIIGYDLTFFETLPKLFPQVDAKSWFVGNGDLIVATAFRNSSLQAAYFMIAARSLGVDCGPMSGFNNAMIDEVFFKDTTIRSNLLCNLGYGDVSKLSARNPRLSFTETCAIL